MYVLSFSFLFKCFISCLEQDGQWGDQPHLRRMAGIQHRFAVTGHWVEERASGKWKLKHALFGFTLMNTAHNGVHLGQALYKICDRLKIVHKVRSHSPKSDFEFKLITLLDWSYYM